MEIVQARPGRPSEGAREAVIAAAHQLFVERDYDEVSTAQILERSGVSRGALYHHFPTKLDLFRAVWEAEERRLLEDIAEAVRADASPFEFLLEGSRAYLRAAESDESLRRIGLLQSRGVLGWEVWREASTELGVGVVLAAVGAAIEAGELPERDPETMAHALLAATIEAALLIAVADDRRAARERSEAVIVDLLVGLRR